MSDSETLCTVAHQAPLSMEFSRQEYWSELPFSSPGDLPHPGIGPGSLVLEADSLQSDWVLPRLLTWPRASPSMYQMGTKPAGPLEPKFEAWKSLSSWPFLSLSSCLFQSHMPQFGHQLNGIAAIPLQGFPRPHSHSPTWVPTSSTSDLGYSLC